MSPSPSPTDPRDPRGGYVVRKPRAGDAVGGSLRNIYTTEPHLPPDLNALLRALDRHQR